MSELLKRTIFGSLYVALILGAITLNSIPLFLSVFSALAFIAICEYTVLSNLHRTRPLRVILDGLACIYLICLAHIVDSSAFSLLMILPYLLFIAYTVIRSLYSNRNEQPAELGKIFLGQLYIALPIALASILHSSSLDFQTEYRGLLILALVCIWSNDTGAYIVGSQIGKHSLFPSLSPKKSWEGFLGGVCFSATSAWLIAHFLIPNTFCHYRAVGLGILISVFSTWGDLFESMLKRNAGMKDSGSIIPGHGGVLDRIDSMLFVLPLVTLAYLILEAISSNICQL